MNDKKIKDYILGKSDEKTGREILEWIKASDENAERFFRIEELCDVMAFEKYHLDKKTKMALERLSNKIAGRRRMNGVDCLCFLVETGKNIWRLGRGRR